MLDLFQNPYVVIPSIAWFVAQLIKFALQSWKGDTSFKYFFKTGNMPSSHTAIVTALFITALVESGADSPELGISFVIAAIVIYDAVNLRRAVGEQGGLLQKLIARARLPRSQREHLDIEEVLGHTPLEVIAGGFLGITVSLILEYRHWRDDFFDSLETTSDNERSMFYIIFGILSAFGGLLAALFARRHLRRLPTGKRISRAVRSAITVPALLGLLLVWLQQEDISLFDNKIWVILVSIWIIVGVVVAYIRTFYGSFEKIKVEREHFSLEKKRQRQKRRKKRRR